MCEAILNDLAVSEWSIVALRYFNPISCDASRKLCKDPRTEPTNFILSLLRVMNGQMPYFRIFETDWDTKDGSAVGDFVYVSGLARATWRCSEPLASRGWVWRMYVQSQYQGREIPQRKLSQQYKPVQESSFRQMRVNDELVMLVLSLRILQGLRRSLRAKRKGRLIIVARICAAVSRATRWRETPALSILEFFTAIWCQARKGVFVFGC